MRLRFWLFFLFACAAIAFRNPDWWLHPQFVAEDGKLFFAQQLVKGTQAFFIPNNGYLHLLPRIIAWAASPFPVVWQPLLYQAVGVAVAAACMAFFVLPECRFVLASDNLRVAVSALAILNSHGEDLFANVAALQVFLFPVGLILLTGNRSGRVRAAVTGIIALTAPALILFLPVAIWRSVKDKRVTAVVYMLCAAVQIGIILTHSKQAVHVTAPLWLTLAASLESWVYRVLVTQFFGIHWALFAGNRFGLTLAVLLAAISFGLFTSIVTKLEQKRAFVLSLIIGPALVFEAFLARQELLYSFQNLRHFTLGGGARYFFMPACALLVALAIFFERISASWHSQFKTSAVFIAIFAIGIRGNYPLTPYTDLHWPDEARLIEAWKRNHTKVVSVQTPPTNGSRWLIELP